MAELVELLFEWFGELLVQWVGGFLYGQFIEPYELRSILFWLAIILGLAGVVWWELR